MGGELPGKTEQMRIDVMEAGVTPASLC